MRIGLGSAVVLIRDTPPNICTDHSVHDKVAGQPSLASTNFIFE